MMEFQMHNVRSVSADPTEAQVIPCSGRVFFVRKLKITDDKGVTMTLRLFSDSAEGLKIETEFSEVAA
jgi:hypothetical protein